MKPSADGKSPDESGSPAHDPSPSGVSIGYEASVDELLTQGVLGAPARPGTLGRIDRFEVLKTLGEGGMGLVVLAVDPGTDVRIAIKLLKPRFASNPQAVHRFLTEARHMSRMSHPNILKVSEVIERGVCMAYAMPYVEGGSLADLIRREGALDPEQAAGIASQVASALAYAHSKGIIHRDIKPTNVMLGGDGRALVADFGLARTVFNDSVVDVDRDSLEGTPAYMSPATARGQAEDTRCDIYALGCLLYEMLTGEPPYGGGGIREILAKVVAGPPVPIRQVAPSADPSLARIAERAMARELRHRYAEMGDLLKDLTAHREGQGMRGRRAIKSPWAWMAVSAVALAIVLGTAAFWLTKVHRRADGASAPTPDVGVERQTAKVDKSTPAEIEMLVMKKTKLQATPPGGKGVFLRVPPELEGAWVYTGDGSGGVADFTVTKAGRLYVACNYSYQGNSGGNWQAQAWKAEDFVRNGWAPVPGLVIIGGNNSEHILFTRLCAAGEAFRLRCNKYGPPFVIHF